MTWASPEYFFEILIASGAINLEIIRPSTKSLHLKNIRIVQNSFFFINSLAFECSYMYHMRV